MQETRVLVETKGTTGEETISYWFDLPIDVAEFEEKLGVGAESGDYCIRNWQGSIQKYRLPHYRKGVALC